MGMKWHEGVWVTEEEAERRTFWAKYGPSIIMSSIGIGLALLTKSFYLSGQGLYAVFSGSGALLFLIIGWKGTIMLGAMIGLFYAIMLIPDKKADKDHDQIPAGTSSGEPTDAQAAIAPHVRNETNRSATTNGKPSDNINSKYKMAVESISALHDRGPVFGSQITDLSREVDIASAEKSGSKRDSATKKISSLRAELAGWQATASRLYAEADEINAIIAGGHTRLYPISLNQRTSVDTVCKRFTGILDGYETRLGRF